MTIMNIKKIIPALIIVLLLGVSGVSLAQTHSSTPADPSSSLPANTGTGTNPPPATNSSKASDINIAVRLKNPLKVNDINDAIKWFVNVLLKIAIPFIVVFFIWSGFNFILARGNEKKVTAAKQMFLWTVIGTLLILGAWVITNAIIGTVNSITS
jgi:hypothetical protein